MPNVLDIFMFWAMHPILNGGRLSFLRKATEKRKDSGLLFWDSYTHLGVLSAHTHTLFLVDTIDF